jgi:hypothetical protein
MASKRRLGQYPNTSMHLLAVLGLYEIGYPLSREAMFEAWDFLANAVAAHTVAHPPNLNLKYPSEPTQRDSASTGPAKTLVT